MELVNHPGMFLNADAAAALERFEADHGVQEISEAGRTEKYQQSLIDRWMTGGKYNRPPYLYEPRRPARLSDHVINDGQAADTPNWKYWRQHAGEYGWVVDYDWDVVHFRYDKSKDKHLPSVAGEKDEDEMTEEQWKYIQGINEKLGWAVNGITTLIGMLRETSELTPGMNDKLDNLQTAAEKLLSED